VQHSGHRERLAALLPWWLPSRPAQRIPYRGPLTIKGHWKALFAIYAGLIARSFSAVSPSIATRSASLNPGAPGLFSFGRLAGPRPPPVPQAHSRPWAVVHKVPTPGSLAKIRRRARMAAIGVGRSTAVGASSRARNEVRTRLIAGGSRIRTLGPT
jgi:hypothetical protein